jgi:hypothetical protein
MKISLQFFLGKENLVVIRREVHDKIRSLTSNTLKLQGMAFLMFKNAVLNNLRRENRGITFSDLRPIMCGPIVPNTGEFMLGPLDNESKNRKKGTTTFDICGWCIHVREEWGIGSMCVALTGKCHLLGDQCNVQFDTPCKFPITRSKSIEKYLALQHQVLKRVMVLAGLMSHSFALRIVILLSKSRPLLPQFRNRAGGFDAEGEYVYCMLRREVSRPRIVGEDPEIWKYVPVRIVRYPKKGNQSVLFKTILVGTGDGGDMSLDDRETYLVPCYSSLFFTKQDVVAILNESQENSMFWRAWKEYVHTPGEKFDLAWPCELVDCS